MGHTPEITSVTLPSTNGRREHTLKHVLRDILDVQSVHVEGYEEPAADTETTAWDKLAQYLRRGYGQAHELLLSNDLMNHIWDPRREKWIPLRKPKAFTHLESYFELLEACAENGMAVMSNSGHTNIMRTDASGQHDAQHPMHSFPMESRLHVNVRRMRELAGNQSLAQWYLVEFDRFYEGKFGYNKVSGFCVLLLTALGCIDMIDGVRLWDDPYTEVQDALYGLTYTATNTLSPQALHYLVQQTPYAGRISLLEIYDRVMTLSDTETLSLRVFDTFWQQRAKPEQAPTLR